MDDGILSFLEDSSRNSFDCCDSFNCFSNSGDDWEIFNRYYSFLVVEGWIKISLVKVNCVEDDVLVVDDEIRGWEECVGEGEVERVVLVLVEVG